MSLQSNASSGNVAYATKYATDKIVGIFIDSFTNGAFNVGGYLYQFPIAHSFTRPVFCEMSWSNNGIDYVDAGMASKDQAALANVYSDSSNVYVLSSVNTGTTYYKIICTWIDDFDGSNPLITPVLQTTNSTYFDSRANYQKVYLPGVGNTGGAGSSGIVSIAHVLGYTPNAKVFIESLPGQVWPQIAGGTSDFWLYDFAHQIECFTLITTSVINMNYTVGASGSAGRLWYRIYLDH